MGNSEVGGQLNARATGCEKIVQFPVVDNVEGPVVFSDPFDKVGTVVNEH